MAPVEKVKKAASSDKKGAKKSAKKVRNYELKPGVLKWSRATVSRRKKFLRLKQRKLIKNKQVKKLEKPKVVIKVVKKIGGAKNGGERTVFLKKPKSNYPTKQRVAKRGPKHFFSRHERRIRPNLKSGRVVILLAGRHAGKRVVLLKSLKSGLLLVTGPLSLNGCPLRRISQRYVLATQTRISLANYRVPSHINDKYFKRAKKNKKARGEGDIFAVKKEKYAVSEQRKSDQITVDKVIKDCIAKHPESKILSKYLKSMFGLKSTQYPHRMTF